MQKHEGFKIYGILLASALIVSACGPIAPSVSKLSNAPGQKTNPTDGASPTNTLNTPGDGSTSSSVQEAIDATPQVTAVQSWGEYRQKWSLVKDSNKSLIEISDPDQIRSLINDGKVSFSSRGEGIRGREAALLLAKVRFHVGLKASTSTIESLELDRLNFTLKWHPVSLGNRTGTWELALAPPNSGDAVKDLNDLKELRDALAKYLTEVGIEFQAE